MPPPPGRGYRNVCPTPLVLVRILPKYVFNIAEKFEILKKRKEKMPRKKSQGPDYKLIFISTVFAMGIWYYVNMCMRLG